MRQLDALRQRHQLTLGHGNELGVATAGQQCTHRLPYLPTIDMVADLGDGSGNLEAQDFACSRRGRIFTGGLKQVGSVDTSGADLHYNLTCGGADVRHFLPFQPVG